MSSGAVVDAQGKINLMLRILSREVSGYHTIETLYQRIALADRVVVRSSGSGRALDCRGADTGPVELNLAYRAAVTYAEATGWPSGFAIEIEKRIPVGGGLGGGSADAGAVLRALNALAPRPIPREGLLTIAGALGADVPFLTLDAPLALAWGRGERLLELPPLPEARVEALAFPFGVSSAEAYGWVAAAREGRPPAITPRSLSFAELQTWEGVAKLAENDFEDEVSRRHPPIAAVLAFARTNGVLIAQVSGSGSTVYAIAGNERGGAFGDPGGGRSEPAGGARLFATVTATSVEDVTLFE